MLHSRLLAAARKLDRSVVGHTYDEPCRRYVLKRQSKETIPFVSHFEAHFG